MKLAAREVAADDRAELVRMYALLAAEMTALDDLWPHTRGITGEPGSGLLERAVSPDRFVRMGTIDDVPVGFCTAAVAEADDGTTVGLIEFIFTEEPARGVGIGDVMLEAVLAELRARGETRFDVRVPPGHRAAKNFFEQHGFSARSITMHHS
jgi:GNAT superfamily N-acetyltransferase